MWLGGVPTSSKWLAQVPFVTTPSNAPTITSVAPSIITQGTSTTLTITGTNLTGGSVAISGSGITLGTSTTSATQITVTATVAADAATGGRTVTVTTGDGSATGSITIAASIPIPPTTDVVYEIRAINSTTEELISGLTPTFLFFVNSYGQSVTPPEITEVGTLGIYHFTYAPAQDISFRIDLGSAMVTSDRYVEGICSTQDVGVTSNAPTVEEINTALSDAHGLGSWEGSSAPTVEEIDAALSNVHGSGRWDLTFTLPALTGQAYSAVSTQVREVTIVQGDTPVLPFNLGGDYTGWSPRFGAKVRYTDTTYVMEVRDALWIDESLGQGSIHLTAQDTAIVGKYHAEIELTQGDQVQTVLRWMINIIPEVIKAAI